MTDSDKNNTYQLSKWPTERFVHLLIKPKIFTLMNCLALRGFACFLFSFSFYFYFFLILVCLPLLLLLNWYFASLPMETFHTKKISDTLSSLNNSYPKHCLTLTKTLLFGCMCERACVCVCMWHHPFKILRLGISPSAFKPHTVTYTGKELIFSLSATIELHLRNIFSRGTWHSSFLFFFRFAHLRSLL